MTRVEFESLLKGHLQDVELAVETSLDNVDMKPSAIATVLMVGGSSRIPVFQQLLRQYFGKEPIYSRNLDEDVARGAALIGTIRTGTAAKGSPLAMLPPPIDRCSHAIGVVALNSEGLEENYVVLPALTPIPTPQAVERTFGTSHANQDRIELVVNEGDEPDLRMVDRLGSAVGTLDGHKPQGHPITVRMSLDGDGILMVTAHDGETGAPITQVEVRHKQAMTTAEHKQSRAHIDDILVL